MFGWPTHVDSLADMHVFLLCFFVGALIPVNGRWLAERFYGLHPWIQRGLLLAALLALMFASRLIAPGVHASPTVVLIETTAAAFLITTVFFGPERKVYRLWPSRTLGEVSYGVYLLHLLILNVVARALLPLFPEPLSPGAALGITFVMAIAMLAITLPIAFVVHRSFEYPLQQLGRRISKTVKGVAGAAPAFVKRGDLGRLRS
jgi:peptidoglycan/LPS O-acetylase OafA/YrhL